MYIHKIKKKNSIIFQKPNRIFQIARSFDLTNDELYHQLNLPDSYNDYEDNLVVFSGFGADRYEITINKTTNANSTSFKYPNKLKFFESTILPLEQCRDVLPVVVTDGNICMNPEGASGFSCLGDSGGPLVYNGDVVVGVRNRHEECTDETPELFTRVSYHLTFINNVLQHRLSHDIVYVQ